MNEDPVAARMELAVPGPDAAQLSRLRDRLAAEADEQGVLDLAYRVVDAPIGPLLVAATADGVVRIAFEGEGHDRVLEQLAESLGPRVVRSTRRTDAVTRQLEEYFAGQRRGFDVAVDLRLLRGFRRRVVESLQGIPYGHTRTYAAVAASAGNPAAVRAAGSACAHNPVPVVVPCHRVVRSDGTIGRYLGGVDAKRALLALEGDAAPSR